MYNQLAISINQHNINLQKSNNDYHQRIQSTSEQNIWQLWRLLRTWLRAKFLNWCVIRDHFFEGGINISVPNTGRCLRECHIHMYCINKKMHS